MKRWSNLRRSPSWIAIQSIPPRLFFTQPIVAARVFAAYRRAAVVMQEALVLATVDAVLRRKQQQETEQP